MSYGCGASSFSGGDTAYIGARVFSAYDTLYGWIKVTGVSVVACTVLEYACNSNNPGVFTPYKNPPAGIYPNPFTTELKVVLDNDEPAQIILYNILSQKFLEQLFARSVNINTSQLSPGIYFYQLRNENKSVSGKVVKAW
jgi:hypothetical protein